MSELGSRVMENEVDTLRIEQVHAQLILTYECL